MQRALDTQQEVAFVHQGPEQHHSIQIHAENFCLESFLITIQKKFPIPEYIAHLCRIEAVNNTS